MKRISLFLLIVVVVAVAAMGCTAPQPRGGGGYSSAVVICGNCRREIPANSKECPFCYKPLKTTPTPATPSSATETPVGATPRSGIRVGSFDWTPRVKVGGLLCLGERDSQRFPDVFAAFELLRHPIYADDPLSPALTVDVGVAYELLFFSAGIVQLVEDWKDFGGFFFMGIDWKRRYGVDEADFAIGFGLYFGGF
ncbi:MAG: hypothetical protein N2234_00320 [Planctomycetota bacterium]|nr:hypothetical protein [Planctomycetota bacterium]